MKRRTWARYVRGWWLGATVGQGFGVGILYHGKFNGIAMHLGPLIVDIVPPAPLWMKLDAQG